MDFSEILKEIKLGLFVKRESWVNDHYIKINTSGKTLDQIIGGAEIVDENGSQYNISNEDVFSNDWKVI